MSLFKKKFSPKKKRIFSFFIPFNKQKEYKKYSSVLLDELIIWLQKPSSFPQINSTQLSSLFSEMNIPKQGISFDSVLKEWKENVLQYSVPVSYPKYIGHMTMSLPWFQTLVDCMISVMNQNQVKQETALSSSFLERQVLAWLHRKIFQFESPFYHQYIQNQTLVLGNVTSGGTVGNITALLVAREKMLSGIQKKGIYQVFVERNIQKVAILVSQRAHYSIKKSIQLLGFGEDALHLIPVDSNNKIHIPLLKQKITDLQNNKVFILALIGIAGTTETGNIDPLEEMANISKKENIWFHVDASWGGSLILSQKHHNQLKGLELADSVTLDGHKMFWLPLTHGICLFKKTKSLECLQQTANYILREDSTDLGKYSVEGSRRFVSLNLWFSLKMLGLEGYDFLISQSIEKANWMSQQIDMNPNFQRTSNPEVCILTYRFIPQTVVKNLQSLKEKEQQDKIDEVNQKYNELNIQIQKKQCEAGNSFVSRTKLESALYSTMIVVFRVVLTNILTTEEDILEILEEQTKIGFSMQEKF